MKLFITIILLLSISKVYSLCGYVNGNNQTLDFSGLQRDSNSPYTYVSNITGMSILFNICGDVDYCQNETPDIYSSICSINSTSNPLVVYSFGDFVRGVFQELPGNIEGIGSQLIYLNDPSRVCGGSGSRNSYFNLICSDVDSIKVISVNEPWNQGTLCQLSFTLAVPCPGIQYNKLLKFNK